MALFHQEVIAVLWDFDRTLTPGFMQTPLFEHYRVDEDEFWSEVDALIKDAHSGGNFQVSGEIVYLNHILDYVRGGAFSGLNNEMLRRLGAEVELFPGIADCLRALKKVPQGDKRHRKYGLKVEHYVISAGLRQMILGSKIHDELDGVWGCEFLEKDGVLDRLAYVIDHTTKTRAVFEISKGVNKHPENITINALMPEKLRRIPIKQMIYVADGPSDVPVFSLLKRNGGRTYGVYDPDSPEAYDKVYKLHNEEKRTDAFGKADYTRDSEARRWLEKTVRAVADEIVERKDAELRGSVGESPTH